MSVFNSVSKSLAVLILILVGFAFINGADFADSELLNPSITRRNDAQTQLMIEKQRQEQERQAILDKADTDAQSRIIAAQADAQVQKIQDAAELELARRLQQIEFAKNWHTFILISAYGVFLSSLLILSFWITQRISSRSVASMRATTGDPWQDREFRKKMRILAQAREQSRRTAPQEPHVNLTYKDVAKVNGSDPYHRKKPTKIQN